MKWFPLYEWSDSVMICLLSFSSCLSVDESFSVCSEATTITSSGSHVPCLKYTTELAEEEGIHQLAMSHPVPPNAPVSLFDLMHALQVSHFIWNAMYIMHMGFFRYTWGGKRKWFKHQLHNPPPNKKSILWTAQWKHIQGNQKCYIFVYEITICSVKL